MNATRIVYISAGSNIGDRSATLHGAMRALDATPGVRVAAVSPLYETDPVGGVPQRAFLNLAARLEVALAPEAMLAEMQRIEGEFGRCREKEIYWGPRTLDLDYLLHEGETRSTESLMLPHPRMWQRSFVLIPLRHVADGALARKLAKFPANDSSVRLFAE